MLHAQLQPCYSTPFVTPVSITTEDENSLTAKKAFEQASSLQRNGFYIEALQNYEKAIDAYPLFFEAWFNIGLCLRFLNKPSEAAYVFEQAAQLSSLYKPVFIELSQLYRELGEIDKASTANARYSML